MALSSKIRHSQRTMKESKPKTTYKDNIAMTKDTLDVIWKLSPVALLPAGLYIWFYLQSIKWTGLFHDAAISVSGLIFLILAVMVIAFSATVLFVVPSVVVAACVQMFERNRKVPTRVIWLALIVFIVWVISLGAIFTFDLMVGEILLIAPLMAALAFGVLNADKLVLKSMEQTEFYSKWGYILALALGITFAMYFTLFPFLLCHKFVSQIPYFSGQHEIGSIALSIAISQVSLLPGFIYLLFRTVQPDMPRSFLKNPIAMMTVFVYLMLTASIMLPPVDSAILQTTGIYSNEKTTYQVLQPNLVGAFTAAGLTVAQDSRITTVSAYARFRFAGTRLLCKDKFEPSSITPDAVRAAREKNIDTRKVAGTHCVPTSAGEIRELRM